MSCQSKVQLMTWILCTDSRAQQKYPNMHGILRPDEEGHSQCYANRNCIILVDCKLGARARAGII